MDRLTPKAVIFDLGSTLIEYEVVSWDELTVKCAARTHAFLQQQGLSIPEEQEYISLFEDIRIRYRDQARLTYVEYQVPDAARELLGSLGIDYQDDLINQFFETYYRPVAEQLYDEKYYSARMMQSFLKRAGFRKISLEYFNVNQLALFTAIA